MSNIGTVDFIVIAVVIIVLFGAKRIPELVRGISKAIKEFRNASKDEEK
jgi:sec-independent protein translocase protein TatA